LSLIQSDPGSSTTSRGQAETITGLSLMSSEVWAKRLQLIREAIPQLTRVTVLGNPHVQWYARAVETLKAVAPSLSIQVNFVTARTPGEIGPAFSAVSRTRAQALYVLGDAMLIVHRATVIRLASQARLPTVFAERRFADEGGLMSYGPNWSQTWRQAAGYVDKILKGAKAGDLPIEQPTNFELVVNLKTAKALGITIPESILLRADGGDKVSRREFMAQFIVLAASLHSLMNRMRRLHNPGSESSSHQFQPSLKFHFWRVYASWDMWMGRLCYLMCDALLGLHRNYEQLPMS
jgi:hypothetical protein